MTSRDWQANRRAVFDRDERTCRHCGAGADGDPTALRTHPVGTVPLEGTVHESSLVTVCPDCFETLHSASEGTATGPVSRADLFELVRETTRTQGGAISDVAAFASLATSMPTLETGDTEMSFDEDDTELRFDEDDTDTTPVSDGETNASVDDETATEYRQTRRTVWLAIDLADARLERLAAIDETQFESDVRASLAAVDETATDLQSTLRAVLEHCETMASGLERCHGCFDPLDDGGCSTCGLEARATVDWERENGDVAFERLFSSINDGLQEASGTTEALTERTTTLARQLTAD